MTTTAVDLPDEHYERQYDLAEAYALGRKTAAGQSASTADQWRQGHRDDAEWLTNFEAGFAGRPAP